MTATDPLGDIEGRLVALSRRSSFLEACPASSGSPSVETLVQRLQSDPPDPHTTYPPKDHQVSPTAANLWVLPVPGDPPLSHNSPPCSWIPQDASVQYGGSDEGISEAHLLSDIESEAGEGVPPKEEIQNTETNGGTGGGSDCDSDVDLMKKMILQRDTESGRPPPPSTHDEDDDEDDDFTVHFVHHGRKSGKC